MQSESTPKLPLPAEPEREPIRIFTVDDHPVIRDALAYVIAAQGDMALVGSAGGLDEALETIVQAKPDILVTDINMPGDGFELIKTAHRQNPALRIIVFSVHEDEDYAFRALQAGANGYIMKKEPMSRIPEAVREVLKKGLFVNDAIRNHILMRLANENFTPAPAPSAALSAREMEIFQLTGKGLTARQIADKLAISVKTVQTYRERIKTKLKVDNSPQLIRAAVNYLNKNPL